VKRGQVEISKAVIYVRVSYAKQIENTSLDSQQEVCRRWCNTHGLDVTRVFIEKGESAKSADRTEFQALFKFLEHSPKGSISHLVVYKFDRFSRNVQDGAAYMLRLKEMNIALRSATEATDETPAGKFLATMLSAVGQFDNDTRAERTLAGMQSRVEAGRWQWPAPLGYINGGKGEPSLLHDPEGRGELVAKLFELVATGEHTKASALAVVTALGLRSAKGAPLTQETIRKMLVNPVYAGHIYARAWNKLVQGDFVPLVSQRTFDRVQSVLAGRSTPCRRHVRSREEFPLRGLVRCPTCDKFVTASDSTGKSGGKFRYYRCHRGRGHMNVRAEVIEDAFIGLLNGLTPHPERRALLERLFRENWEQNAQAARNSAAAYRRELEAEQRRKKRILNQLADGVIGASDFSALNNEITERMEELNELLSVVERRDLSLDDLIEAVNHELWNTSINWQTAELRLKLTIQSRLFPEGVQWQQNGFGTPQTHWLYELLGTP